MKGKVLEQIVQKILLRQGYDRLSKHDAKFDSSTGKFEGRGADHELDAFGQYKHSIPFVHPIRLFGEAKCYKSNVSVGVDIIREAITVRKDIDENYEKKSEDPGGDRRVECFAVFSTSGFSSAAIELARAHGIYLVWLGHLRPLVDKILRWADPQTHQEVEKAVDSYLFAKQDTSVYFANLTGGHPIALRGSLPKERLSHTDSLYASVSQSQSETKNVTQFTLQNSVSDSQWEFTTGALTWMLDNATDQTDEKHLTLVIPTALQEIARQIRIEVPIESVESLQRRS